jgi:hypothetical protein
MAKLISSGQDIGFTILPYTLDTPIQQELNTSRSNYMIGYIRHNKDSGEYKFIYGGRIELSQDWSLDIIKELPYCDEGSVWIVYNCPPRNAALEFSKILRKSQETLHVYNWDIWAVEGKDSKVAVITSWEII